MTKLAPRHLHLLTALLWAAAVAAGLYARPLMPIDETRYVTVAWEMHLADHWLVPLLNGEAYHHKPPLLFWLMRLGWIVFGPNEWSARLVAPLFGAGSLILTAVLGKLLWPKRESTPLTMALAPLILVTGAWWMLFATLTMFDLLMAFFALAGWIGIVLALMYRRLWQGVLLLALAIGFGVLAKGPAILVYVLPPAALAPLWAVQREARPSWFAWYGGLLLALVGGAAIGLAWALPAAEAGGPVYKQALLWGQTAGRVKDSFAHKRTFWWYLPLLPALFFPWLLWRPGWAALLDWRRRDGVSRGGDPGSRFTALAALSGLIIFSAISGKQPHYLLPLAPAMALLMAQGLADGRGRPARADILLPAALVMIVALALAFGPQIFARFPRLADSAEFPDWLLDAHGNVAAVLGLCAVTAVALGMREGLLRRAAAPALLLTALFLVVHLGIFPPARQAYDLAPAADVIRRGQEEGRPVAYAGDYHGEYQFLGRLKEPLPEIAYANIPAWLKRNPNGWVVARYRRDRLDSGPQPVYAQPKRGRIMVIWDHDALQEKPEFFAPS